MKKFILFVLFLAAFLKLHSFIMDSGFFFPQHQKIIWNISFTDDGSRTIMHWDKLPYPCLYCVESLSPATGEVAQAPPYQRFAKDFVLEPDYLLPQTPIPMHYRITAYSPFAPQLQTLPPAINPRYTAPTVPAIVSHYPAEKPCSLKPYLLWHTVPGAVCYEVELLAAPPEEDAAAQLSTLHHLFSTNRIYTNGWQADLTALDTQAPIYWRVRALNLDRQPIGVFSPAEPLHIDAALPVPDRPLIQAFDRLEGQPAPLYPVYQWIPMNGVSRYEVELMTAPPARDHDRQPTRDRIWYQTVTNSFSCYDEYARPYAGPYYWRVRGVDAAGNTIGTYSDTGRFLVAAHRERPFAAAFGDSITHGGGALSYSPFNFEYNYTTYLDFPACNLGRSGDTAQTSCDRFEADVLPCHPLNLLILSGSNDLRADISAAAIIKALDTLGEKCRAHDIRPIFLTLMPIHPPNIQRAFHTGTDRNWYAKMKEINAFIRQQEYYIDLEPYFYDPTLSLLATDLSIDGLHPDIRGKKLMAEIINANLDKFRR